MFRKHVRAALIGAGIFMGTAAVLYAYMQPVWQTPYPNETNLTYNNTYPFQTNNSRVDNLAYQCIYTSATVVSTRFNDSAITLNSAVISATNTYSAADPSAKGAVGYEVWLSTSNGFVPAPLVWGTTYYVVPITPSSFSLAATSTGAVAGSSIVLTSSRTTDTFTLNPLAITGTPSFKWQVSNDGTNYNDLTATSYNVTISSVTMLSYTLGGSSTVWDFGPFDYTWVRLNVIAPTKGGIALKCTPNGEGQSGSY